MEKKFVALLLTFCMTAAVPAVAFADQTKEQEADTVYEAETEVLAYELYDGDLTETIGPEAGSYAEPVSAAVARIGETTYESLAAAVAEAQNNDIIILTDNASGDGIALLSSDAKTITIDLNGFAYDVSGQPVGSPNTENQGFHLEQGNTVTIKNGTLKGTSAGLKMLIQNYCNLTLTDVCIDGRDIQYIPTDTYVLSNNHGNVLLNGNTTILTKEGQIAMDSCKFSSYEPPVVTVDTTGAIGVIELSGGKLYLENGEIGEIRKAGDYQDGDAVISSCISETPIDPKDLKEGCHCIQTADKKYKAEPHTVVTDPAKEPTCTEPGLTEGSHCSGCAEVFISQQELPVVEHSWEIVDSEPASCTTPGKKTGVKCKFCDKFLIEQEEIAPTGHVIVTDAAVEETCTEPGLTEGSHCSACGEVFTEQQQISAKGHALTEHEAAAPDCEAAGYETYEECSRCSYTTYQEIPKLGHFWIIADAVAPTCDQDGKKTGIVCERCEKYLLEQQVIPATGNHEWEVKKAEGPTCTESGQTAGVWCKTCGKFQTRPEYVPPLGHSFTNYVSNEDATETQDGTKTAKCDRCDETDTLPDEGTMKFPFKDVPRNSWFFEGVRYTYENHVMNGMSSDTFAPSTTINRAMAAQILYNMAGQPDVSGLENPFTDVEDAWYTKAVLWAASNGIVKGYEEDHTFRPDNDILRQDFAIMLHRYAEYSGYYAEAGDDLSGYADCDVVSPWAREAMEWAVSFGIITGKDEGTRLDPHGNASRCEVAIMMSRFLKSFVNALPS